jgi:hypothetical protein
MAGSLYFTQKNIISEAQEKGLHAKETTGTPAWLEQRIINSGAR